MQGLLILFPVFGGEKAAAKNPDGQGFKSGDFFALCAEKYDSSLDGLDRIKQAKSLCKVYLTKLAKHAILIVQSKHCIREGSGTVKTKIPELRKSRKVSQEELALAVGVTRQTITSIEVGKYTASLPLAYKIAKYFGLSIEEIFDFSNLEGSENE